MGMSETRIGTGKGQSIALAVIGAGLLLLGVVVLVIYLPQAAAGSKSTDGYASVIPAVVDYPAPELAVKDLQGNPVSLKGLAGTWVLVNHWATWCPPCKAEMPVLVEYYEAHKNQNFVVLAIESGDSAENVAKFARDYGLSFLVWPDPDQKGLEAFNQEYLPSSYLIDPSGQVRLFWGGPVSRENLEKYVTPRLEE